MRAGGLTAERHGAHAASTTRAPVDAVDDGAMPANGGRRAARRRPRRRPRRAPAARDLFAIVEEHADEAALPVDRDARRGGVPLRLRAPRRPAPQVGRGLHRPPGRRREDLRRACASTPRRCARRCCTTPSRTRQRRSTRSREHFGEEVAALVDGVTKLDRHHLPVARRGAGRELPQDDGRDGLGHPGHPHQARRPPAQHAHDRRDAQAEADREGQGDARDLRADRAPARHPRDQVGARGPRVRDAAPAQVPGDQGPGQPAARGARGTTSRRPATTCRASSRRSASTPRSPGAPSTSTRSTRR